MASSRREKSLAGREIHHEIQAAQALTSSGEKAEHAPARQEELAAAPCRDEPVQWFQAHGTVARGNYETRGVVAIIADHRILFADQAVKRPTGKPSLLHE